MSRHYKIFPLGDSAITVDFGDVINEKINQKVIALFHHWRHKKPVGVKDIIPAYSSLTIEFDVSVIRNQDSITSAYSFIKDQLEQSISNFDRKKKIPSSFKEIPVCYEHSLAPDLKELARKKKISENEVIELHSGRTYRVYMIGFLPGFPYMGKVDKRIATPRKSTPQLLVHAGSVGIAGEQTGIYPFDSPGGWNIIGQTPLCLFDTKKTDPVLMNAGDEVKFIPITLKEFERLRDRQ